MTVVQSKGPLLGMRHVQALLIFTNIAVVYISRLNVAVAVVAMTNAEKANPNFPEYDWNEKHKAYILSSLYWGYVWTQLPSGYLCRRFGAKRMMFISTFGSALFSAITPVCIPWGGWQVFCAIRILQGLFQGIMFPCIYEHIAKWSPMQERNRLGTLSLSGLECGTVLSMAISGVIAAGPMGWPGISYVSAALCFIWCLFWLAFAANNPSDSRFITEAELKYIAATVQQTDVANKPKVPVPWRAIFTSTPFIALIFVRLGQGWGFSTLQAELPSYLNGVLDMNIRSNALFSTLPYLAMWLTSYVYMFAADLIMKYECLTLSQMRKIFSSISHWLPALTLLGVGFLEAHQQTLAITLITVTVGINSGNTIGAALNLIDLSPRHVGTLMSIVNTLGTLMLLITPLVVGAIVVDESDRTQWQIVFIIAAVFFFVGNLIYVIWGTTQLQPWNADDFLLPKDAETTKAETLDENINSATFENNLNVNDDLRENAGIEKKSS